ncbi:hypothetical protein LCGC14_3023020, partial [marine sediment metagenome]
MTIAVYCRVSTVRQKTDSQVAEITKWLTANGYDEDQIQWFSDKETGKTLHRTQFNKLQKAIFAGEVRTVVVWKLDRISRRLRDGINLLADWCDRGVRVVSITQAIDLTGAVGRMIAAVAVAANSAIVDAPPRQIARSAAAYARSIRSQ